MQSYILWGSKPQDPFWFRSAARIYVKETGSCSNVSHECLGRYIFMGPSSFLLCSVVALFRKFTMLVFRFLHTRWLSSLTTTARSSRAYRRDRTLSQDSTSIKHVPLLSRVSTAPTHSPSFSLIKRLYQWSTIVIYSQSTAAGVFQKDVVSCCCCRCCYDGRSVPSRAGLLTTLCTGPYRLCSECFAPQLIAWSLPLPPKPALFCPTPLPVPSYRCCYRRCRPCSRNRFWSTEWPLWPMACSGSAGQIQPSLFGCAGKVWSHDSSTEKHEGYFLGKLQREPMRYSTSLSSANTKHCAR